MKLTDENLVEEGETEIGFEEAEKMDKLSSKFFKPETNIEYKLTFKSFVLVRKSVPCFDDKSKSEIKPVLKLIIDSLDGVKVRPDGTPLALSWEILSPKVRAAFDIYCRNGNILKKQFSFKQKGESKDRTYQVAELGDKGF